MRLKVVPRRVPPLRERISDMALLVDHFLDKICRQEHRPVKMAAPEVVDHLSNYSWPGNIRELEHQVEKAVVMSGDRQQLYATDFAILPAGAPAEDLRQDMQFLGPGLGFGNLLVRLERALPDPARHKT